jgi:hypothetical protein
MLSFRSFFPQNYVKTEVGAERLVVNKGYITCPHRGPGNHACESAPWEEKHLIPKLDDQTKRSLVEGLRHMVGRCPRRVLVFMAPPVMAWGFSWRTS